MTMLESLTLAGCAPTPLASYLKALGVLRLISSDANHVSGLAADPKARGWWENEHFHLKTTLHRDVLLRFFLDEYAPSPIIAPWNGGSGFYPKDNKDGFNLLASETLAKRFEPIAEAIRIASQIITRQALADRPEGSAKVEFVAALRANLPESALNWIDAALALSGGGLSYPQLLGTGGNDGRLDFTNNFARRLISTKQPLGIFDAVSGKPLDETESLLTNALFDVSSKGFNSVAIGQFAPGATGGSNATTGYKADGNVNPWDFILMLEGATAFAGAATRRHQGQDRAGSKASFPFTVYAVGAGWGGIETADENDARAEFWAPLWRRPATYREIDALLTEGRAILNGRTARDGLDFARAAASLGVSRGFSEFERYGFLMRAGKAYFATPLGRRSAAPSPATQLIADLDVGGWLDRVRRVVRNDNAPTAARNAIKRFEDTLFELTKLTKPQFEIQRTLIALGEICNWLAVSRNGRDVVNTPPPALSWKWIQMADDGSPEFRIAAALAGIGLPSVKQGNAVVAEAMLEAKTTLDDEDATDDGAWMQEHSRTHLKAPPPMAAHFAPIDEDSFFNGQSLRRRRAWSKVESPSTVVWGAGNLVSNMIAVLERRLVEATIRGLDDKPLSGATYAARFMDIAGFLSNGFNDARCAALLAGLVWVRPAYLSAQAQDDTAVSFAYAALKPIFSPDKTLRRIGVLDGAGKVPIPSGLVARLRASGGATDGYATDAAVRTALARARASGLPSPFDSIRAGGRRPGGEGGRIGVGLRADRLAAALLVPIDDKALAILLKRAYPEIMFQSNDKHLEETNDAA